MDSDAEYYQQHKDDEAEWGDAVPAPSSAKSESRRLASMVSVRLSPEEVDFLRAFAVAQGQSLSGFLRACALAAANRTSLNEPLFVRAATETSTGPRTTDAKVPAMYSSGPARTRTSVAA